MLDSLASLMTGSGTTIDPRSQFRWLQNLMADVEVENAYRGSWLMRKIVNLPAYDMTRAGRDWQTDDANITKLAEEEERLKVWEKLRMAIIAGRLGGGALIMGTGEALETPINSDSIGPGELKYLFLAAKSQLKAGDLIIDPANPEFGEPETFELTLANGTQATVHYSRMLVFKGEFSGNLSDYARKQYWGDSVVSNVMDAVNNATISQNEFASLITQAKIDVFKMPKLMQNAANPDYERRFTRRMEVANMAKSNFRAQIMDSEEEWEQRQLNLTGMPEMIRAYIEIVAGAADIPATRLLGKSPDGMNATGESDQNNYDQMIRAKQENELRPLLEKLDQVLIPSAGVAAAKPVTDAANDEASGDRKDDLYFEFSPLNVMGEKEAAAVEYQEAQALGLIVNTGLFQDEALEEAYSNRMIESGRWPGYEKARDKALKAAESEPDPADVSGVSNPPAPGQEPTGTPGTPGSTVVHIHAGGGSGSTG